jgi:putative transposase
VYHVEKININPENALFEFCDTITNVSKNMYNVANFYIRNTMTGLSKEAANRTTNEAEVLRIVQDGINAHNEKALKKQTDQTKAVLFEMPTKEHWFLNYYVLDAVFKESDNVDYRSHHAHITQNSIKECVQAWKSYFELKKMFFSDSGSLTGGPKIPNYIKSDHKTVTLSNIACKIQNGLLRFPKCKEKLDVSIMPHFGDKLIEVRVVPYCGIYQIQIVTDDGVKNINDSLCNNVKDIPAEAGVAMLDPGVRNFATIADNKGNAPIIVKGEVLVSANQLYNKQMSRLRSIQMQGHDPKVYHPPITNQMEALLRKRDAFLTDTFYKIAHYIFRTMRERNLSYLIVGKNNGWKQKVNIGHKNNQEFVNIPH